jgi:hypothetical protein
MLFKEKVANQKARDRKEECNPGTAVDRHPLKPMRSKKSPVKKNDADDGECAPAIEGGKVSGPCVHG